LRIQLSPAFSRFRQHQSVNFDKLAELSWDIVDLIHRRDLSERVLAVEKDEYFLQCTSFTFIIVTSIIADNWSKIKYLTDLPEFSNPLDQKVNLRLASYVHKKTSILADLNTK